MARRLTTALIVANAKPITRPGYLLQWNMSPLMRHSNAGPQVWNGVTWAAFDFSITGLKWDPDQENQATVTFQNLDGAMGAQFLNVNMADITVDVYYFEASALGVADVPKICQLASAGSKIDDKQVTVQLVQQNSRAAFSPRITIDPQNGFNWAMAPNTQIPWENEIFIVQEDNSAS